MKTKAILSLACLLAMAMTSVAQKKYDIKFDLKPGKKVEMSTVSSMPMDMTIAGQTINMVMTMQQDQSVEALSKEGANTKISLRNTKMLMTIAMPTMGVNQTLSSEDDSSQESAMFRALTSEAITATLNPNGQIVGEADDKALMEALAKSLPQGMDIDMFKVMAKNMAKAPFGGIDLPNKPIAIGESWKSNFALSFELPTNGEVNTLNMMTLTLKEVTDKQYIVDGVSDITSNAQGFELNGTMTAVYKLDRATGLISNIEATIQLAGDGEIQGQPYKASAKGDVKTTTK